MGLKPGTKVPNFRLKDQDGQWFSPVDLKDGQAWVLFFYPKDYTPGCTKEVCSFRDRYEEFQELGAEVIGISSDTESRHQKFSRSYGLPFRLLADSDGQVRKLFKVKGTFFNLIPGRETYVIDGSGTIRMTFNSADPSNHMKKALEALKHGHIS